jgi:multicomponent K+:H+ antiporter subunit D
MTGWAAHLVVVPVVLPLACGALMLLLDERRHAAKSAMGLASIAVLACAAAALVFEAPMTRTYALGDWPPPFGIVLVSDPLAAMMVLLAAVVAFPAMVFSLPRWQRAGPRFHSLVQFLLAGLNGAFLTGDLFNLFVFFELLLAASYGLALHGSGRMRVRESLHYIVINLTASLFFLVGVSLLYGVTGTLNMADMALRIPSVPAADRVLVESGAAILAIAFLVKAGMWPLGFWLPSTYAAASAPAAALFSILSKVGIYAVLRLWLLLFDAGTGATLLLVGGVATIAYGTSAMLASQELARTAGASLLVSSGTILAAIGSGIPAAVGAALYYLVVSTLGAAAFFLLVELVERAREPGANVLAVTAEAFAEPGTDADGDGAPGAALPAGAAILGVAFMGCALLVAGLPPMPAFIAKFALLSALLAPASVPVAAWVLLAVLVLSGLASIMAMARVGMRIFWASRLRPQSLRLVEMGPVAALLVLCLALTAAAGPAMRYMQETERALHAPRAYIDKVLSTP